MRRLALIAIPLGLVAGSALYSAAPNLPGKADPANVAAGTYLADPSHTLVGWRVNHMGFNDYFGLFGSISGTLALDPAHLDQAKVAIRIPVRKILTASEGLTGHLFMPSADGSKPDYFGPKPADALFESTAVKPGPDGTSATIEGRLTLNGVTRPVTIEAQFVGAGRDPLTHRQTIGFHGSAKIMRSDFGLNADMSLVGDAVDLTISAGFYKQG